MFENITDSHESIGNNPSPTGELLPQPDIDYLLPIVGAQVVEATNFEAPNGSPDGGSEKFFFVDPDRDR